MTLQDAITMSHPAWVCGLKSFRIQLYKRIDLVTPRVGVWIEILEQHPGSSNADVTPRVGVWIEILSPIGCISRAPCHTPRGCVD